jgi:hypothetical protein
LGKKPPQRGLLAQGDTDEAALFITAFAPHCTVTDLPHDIQHKDSSSIRSWVCGWCGPILIRRFPQSRITTLTDELQFPIMAMSVSQVFTQCSAAILEQANFSPRFKMARSPRSKK